MAKKKGRTLKPETTTHQNGGRSVLDHAGSGQGEAYDAKGKYLGFGTKESIEFAAAHGRILDPRHCQVSELSVWELWNDAVRNCGEEVMQAEDGSQIMSVDDDVYLRVEKDDAGWSVEWLVTGDLEDRYWDDANGCYALVYADKPFILQ